MLVLPVLRLLLPTRHFQAYLESEPEKAASMPFEMRVQTLTTGFWPTYKQVDVALPASFAKCQAVFRTYYDTKTSHRRLNWVYSLGNATVKGHFAKSYDFQVTTLQAITLLAFNSRSGSVRLLRSLSILRGWINFLRLASLA